MKQIILLAAVVGMAGGSGLAAPLNLKDVAADPSLVAHVDLDALKATSVGKTILADPDVQTKLSGVQAAFNFDFRTQLHGLTVFTTGDHADEPAAIIYADFDPDRLVTLARAFPGFSSETNGARIVYSWANDKKGDSAPRIYAAIAGHRVIFSKREESLTGALDVIDGKTDSLANGKMLLPAESGESVVAEGSLLKFQFGDNNPGSAIFQASKAVKFKLGEVGDTVGATVSFEAKDEDSAAKIQAMVNGLLALLQFQKDNPDLLKLANAIHIKQDGAAVTLKLTQPSADIVAMLKKSAEEKERREEHASDTNAPDTNAPAKNL